MIKIEFKDNSDIKVQAFLTKFTPRLRIALTAEMWRIVKTLANVIGTEKLSQRGPTTLGNVTGNLRRAVMSSADVESAGNSITGSIGIPQEAKYGVYHELGAHVPEVVNKLMVFQSGGETVFTRRHRAFDLPERSFLRSTLADRQSWIMQRLNSAVERVVASEPA